MAIEKTILKEQEIYDAELADKRHRELLQSLKRLYLILSSDNGNSGIEKAIGVNSVELKGLVDKISNLKFDINSPNVSIETNQDKVVAAISGLKEQLLDVNKLLSDQNGLLVELLIPKEYDLEFSRNEYGMLQSPVRFRLKKGTQLLK